ncbi:MAG: DNA mismatch repair protein MutS [Myxococcota bacterium]
MARQASDTPMMQQYFALKRQAGDALLFFRMGDFYELFGADAEEAAPLLDLVLTTRDKGVPDPTPMCGLPFHALEGYLRKVLKTGRSVAIAEQVEDSRHAKGLVKREIVEVVTPGLVSNPERLEGARANYLAAVISDDGRYGLAYVDVSTGEFAATESPERVVHEAELDRLAPREIVARSTEKDLPAEIRVRHAPDSDFDPAGVGQRFGRLPEGLGANDRSLAARAAAALWATIGALQPGALDQIHSVRRYVTSDRLLLDAATRRHLELFRNLRDGGTRGTLFELLDQTRTPLGRRRLECWLGEPLVDLAAIRARQDRVAEWLEPDSRRRSLAEALRGVGDLERSLSRVCLQTSGPREFAVLRAGLGGVATVNEIAPLADPLAETRQELERVLVDDPAPAPRGEPHTGYVRDGVDVELDRVRREAREGDDFLAGLELSERQRLGIPSLRVKYNRVFGYSIQVTKSQLDKVPDEYKRKQTTANGERFTTEELQRWEGIVLRSRERAAALEARVLERLRDFVRGRAASVRQAAGAIAELDVAQSLAQVARERSYVRPEVDDSLRIEIEAGRHPVVENFAPEGFVANDVVLDPEDARFLILTGPNMSGKSTLLRQVALITLLAQAGSFVPARRARIGVADRIFTRVGASDSITTGESTFMMEMRETATILQEATPRSLVVLDEIGRGTSTFDGLSIAWAVAEHLHDVPGLRSRVLFATHYHELADLAHTKSAVQTFHFACAERGGEVLFLRRMEPGAASRSYGIEVARVAGLPPEAIQRARQILANLEGGEFDDRGAPRLAREAGEAQGQLPLFPSGSDPLRSALRALDTDRMTPLDALVELERLRGLAEEGG